VNILGRDIHVYDADKFTRDYFDTYVFIYVYICVHIHVYIVWNIDFNLPM
jgi:hypothetical protein